MKVKNLVLFGFVLSALNYLSSQARKEKEERCSETDLDELKDIDLEQIRHEVGDKLETMVGEFGIAVSSVVSIGSEAFDRYIKELEQKEEAASESDVCGEEAQENPQMQELMSYIQDAMTAVPSEEETCRECGKEECRCAAQTAQENLEEVALSSAEEDAMLRDLEQLLSEEDEEAETSSEAPAEESYYEEIQNALEESFREQAPEEEASDNPVAENVESDESAKVSLDIDRLFSDIFAPAGEETVREEVSVEEQPEELPQEEPVDNKEKEEEISAYVRQLVDELEAETVAEEASAETADAPQEEADKDEEIYQQINEMYPYLSKEFITRVYELKEVIAQNYPLNEWLLVLHRVHFNRLDDLQQFVEIVSNHGYNVNVDENKMIVDLFRRYMNTDGKILSNIFEIANQAGLLHGVYEGYWIDTEKED